MADYRTLARRTARKYGLPENIFLSMIGAESSWRPRVISSAGAVGLGQLMPGTARGLGVDPFNPKQNLDGSARYLRMQIDRFGNVRDALRAYNQGPNAITDPSAGAEYADKILGGRAKVTAPKLGKAPRIQSSVGMNLDPLKIAFGDDPEFLDLLDQVHQEQPVALPGPELETGEKHPVKYAGKKLILPTTWKATHVTDGLGWGTPTAADIMARAGTPVGAPEGGVILRWDPEGAQGGGSMWFRSNSGRVYWLGHIANGLAPGTKVRRGQVIARVSSDHPRPHVHIDAR